MRAFYLIIIIIVVRCAVVVVGTGSHANVSWLTAASSVNTHADVTYDVIRADDYDHGDYVDEDSDDDDEAASLHARSCIGVRKRCLVDGRCARHLSNYRHYCRENKKQNECVAVER